MQQAIQMPAAPIPHGFAGSYDPRPCFIEISARGGVVSALGSDGFTRREEPIIFGTVDEGKRVFSQVAPPDGPDAPKGPYSIRLVIASGGMKQVVRERHFANTG